jgi:tetratricopeptide (TPR) repeat protein
MPENNQIKTLKKLLSLINEIIETLKQLSPDIIAKKEKEWKAFLIKLALSSIAGIGFFFGAWEFLGWVYERYEIDKISDRYAKVADEIYYKENNPDVALIFINKAIEFNDSNSNHQLQKAYIEGLSTVKKLMNLDRPYTKEELDEAHTALAQAILLQDMAKNKPEPYILQGQIYIALKNYDKALLVIKKAIAIKPDNDFAHIRLATLLSEEGKVDEALQEIDKAIKLNSKSIKWAWLWKGIIISQNRQEWNKAREYYHKALTYDEKFDMAFYNLGWSYLKQNPPNYDEAKKYFKKVTEINPDYKEAYYGLGMVYGYQDNYEVAKVYFDKAINVDQKFLSAWKWRGIVLDEMNLYIEALENFTQAIEIDPNDIDLYIRRANTYKKNKNIDKAIADLQYAFEMDQKNPRILMYLGDIFADVNDNQNAFDYYNKAIKINPEYAEAYANRARIWTKLNKLENALEDLDKAMEVSSYKLERFYFQKGQIYEKMGEVNKALENYQLARETNDTMDEAFLSETKILMKMGKYTDALKAIERYITLKPQDESGHKLKEEINKYLSVKRNI